MRKPLACLMGAVLVLFLAPAAHAAFPGLSGKIAFSHTPGNPGTSRDIYVMQPDGSGLIPITGLPDDEDVPAWSADGTKIAFGRGGDVWTMNSDGTGQINLTTGLAGVAASPSWSPDGSKIAFSSTHDGTFGQNIYTMNADGSGVTRVSFGTPDQQPAWSPDGLRIAFVRPPHIYTVKPDGSDTVQLTSGVSARQPNWSPSGARIAYAGSDGSGVTGIHTINADGSNDVNLTASLIGASDPAWSPDGSKLAVNRNSQIWTMNADGTSPIQLTNNIGNNNGPDWQPLPYPGYPRPLGAGPIRVPFVPAFAQCTAPDRTHGPPLSFGSCSGPDKLSPNVTVGTPDANGAPANSIGYLHMRVAPGAPGPPSDTQVWITYSMSDIRCDVNATTCGNANSAGGADYIGELQGEFTFQSTDKYNGPGNNENATMTDYTFRWPAQCTQTADASIGSLCSMSNLSMDAIVPGIVLNLEGKRAVWQMSQIRFYDGGADGDGDTTGDNTLFAVQGLFVP